MNRQNALTATCLIVGACGLTSTKTDRAEQAIVGGSDTTIEATPWQVSLQTSAGFHFCGGSVLSSEWILTAQHCVVSRSPGTVRIAAGMTRLSQASSGQIRNVSEIFRFPDYTNATLGHDVALLRLATPLDLAGGSTTQICLSTQAQGSIDTGLTAPGVSAKVTGWGTLRSGGPSPDILQTVNVPIISQAAATAAYGFSITDDQLGAGDVTLGGVDSCQGDSGGPLTVTDGTGDTKLAGVVSWGFGCADPRYPGMYARVSSFTPWITDITMIEACTDLALPLLQATVINFLLL